MKKILYVDDDVSMHKMVDLFLRNLNCKVQCAKNGRSALKLMNDIKFDIIISDIQMPEMDGITFLEEIRKKNKTIPFVVLSAFGQDTMAKKAKKKGATLVIVKPFESKKLQTVVKELTAD